MVSKNLYVWHYVAPITAEWHNGGGLLVAAESQDEAIALAKAHMGQFEDYREGPGDPDLVASLPDAPEWTVYTHPDQGCC